MHVPSDTESTNGNGNSMSIEELKYQCNPWNRKHPTIRLSWQAPMCQVPPRDIEYVVYANDEVVQVVSGPVTSVVLSTLTPLKNYNFRVTARHKGTKQEGLYYHSFEIFLGGLLVAMDALCDCVKAHAR